MDSERSSRVAFSPMNVIAGASTVVLFGAIAWSSLHRDPSRVPIFARGVDTASQDLPVRASVSSDATSSASSTTPLGDAILSQFADRYIALSGTGVSTDTAANSAADILPSVQARTFTEGEIPFDTDTSLARVLAYREDMRTALAPLLRNTTPELQIYAQWIDTGDTQYLTQLGSIADDYETSIEAARKVKVPSDAVHYQVGVLNAMSQFSAALRALALNAQDPIASVTLLRTYNMAEEQMFTAFNSLGIYSAQKATTTPQL